MSSTGATLSGSFEGATGTITETGFYYGTDSGNLSNSVASGSTSSPFSKAITGLTANTTYYYKAYVVEAGQERLSAVASFKTKAVATATVSTTAAGSITQTSAVLNGSYTGATGAVSRVGFKYGTSSGNLNQDTYTAGSTTPFNKTISGLTEGTTYYFKAYVVEANENTGGTEYRYGSELSFTTTSSTPVAKPGHLGCYEIPAVSATYDAAGDESYGTTQWYRYATGNANQKVVTHTFYNDYVSPKKTMRSYTLLQDYDKKCALWVACAMNNDDYPQAVSRSDAFGYDPALPNSWQPDMSSSFPDKGGKSYDRGHQLAASYRETTTPQVKMTCYATNMTPQLSSLNQGVWQSTVEANVRNLAAATTGRDTLYVVSGPLFSGSYDTVEDKNGLSCAKPTHYFQCFMKVKFNNSGEPQSAKGAAYLVEHVASPTPQYVTIDYVESLAGFDFFANVPTSIQNTAEATATALGNF